MLLCIIAVCNNLFDRIDGVQQAFAMKITYWKEALFLTMKFAQQPLTIYYAEVTPMKGKHLMSM
jgi:hypothetical protein